MDAGTGVAAGAVEPILQGTFALYNLEDGSMVLAYRKQGSEDTERLHVPAYVMSMAGSLGGKDPLAMLKGMAA
jgi:hypothetical protein